MFAIIYFCVDNQINKGTKGIVKKIFPTILFVPTFLIQYSVLSLLYIILNYIAILCSKNYSGGVIAKLGLIVKRMVLC